jgi:glycosyltransferase involved in cell wall biosynthesis
MSSRLHLSAFSNMTVSVTIITKDRPQLLSECIDNFLNQTVLPTQIVIVEDVSDFQSASEIRTIKKKLTQKKISFVHKKVRFKNYAASRNVAFAHATGQLIISCDDDVILTSQTVEDVILFHKKYPKVAAQFPLLVSVQKTIWAEFDSFYVNDYRRLFKKPTAVSYSPTAFFSIKKKILQKNKLTFDSALYIGEDHDFFRKLEQSKNVAYFDPKLVVAHYFRDTFWSFTQRHLEYSRAIPTLYSRDLILPELLSYWIPDRKIKFLLFPFFLTWRAIDFTLKTIHRLKLSKKYILPAFVDTLTVIYGLYFSELGRKTFFQQFKKAF